jgi:putative oxidoreductase
MSSKDEHFNEPANDRARPRLAEFDYRSKTNGPGDHARAEPSAWPTAPQSFQFRGADAMSVDDYARWFSRASVAAAIIMIGCGLSVVLSKPVTGWFTASVTVWMALLLISAVWQLRGSFVAIASLALATAVVARLFSILRLDPPASIAGLSVQDLDLQVATGPGVPGFELLGWLLGALVFVQFILRAASVAASADSREASLNASALMFVRVYLGLMFVPHFGSHILGGPFQFEVYTLYFASLGLHMPAIQVVLAGAIELISAVGLTLGLITRPVALLGSVYLLMSMVWGGHFQIGYVWALPDGGYEFGVFWAVMIAMFAVLGGGQNSVDRILWRSEPARRLLPSVVRKVLAS